MGACGAERLPALTLPAFLTVATAAAAAAAIAGRAWNQTLPGLVHVTFAFVSFSPTAFVFTMETQARLALCLLSCSPGIDRVEDNKRGATGAESGEVLNFTGRSWW